MALGLDIPLIEINHMQAHVLAHFIDDPKPAFPFLCLTVSGGHTQIVKVTGPLEMEIIGETRDDAVGEALIKQRNCWILPYPGGPLIDKYAAEGNPLSYPFPFRKCRDWTFHSVVSRLLFCISCKNRSGRTRSLSLRKYSRHLCKHSIYID
jgi:N6-L-threonylcarbamoyladenine synthase